MDLNVERLIRKHEGKEKFPYKDTKGNITIGIGRNLSAKGLSEDEIDLLFENDLMEAETRLNEILAYYKINRSGLPEEVVMVLIDMSFNMGYGLKAFKRMFKAVKKQDWEWMIEEMKDSVWCREVKSRCDDNVGIIRRMLYNE